MKEIKDGSIETRIDVRDSAPEDPKEKKSLEQKIQNWLKKKKSWLMVVASLIATMGFQLGVNPPGGVWQDDNYLVDSKGNSVDPQGNYISYYVDEQNNTVRYPRTAGYAVLARNNRGMYRDLYLYNTTGFISSLSIIFLLISGLPVKNRFFMWILIVIAWVAISATAMTYNTAVRALTPDNCLENIISNSLYVWIGLTILVFIAHIIRLFFKMLRKLWRLLVMLVTCSWC